MLNTLVAVLTAQNNNAITASLAYGQFKFMLTSAGNTSAGVYNQNDQLVRTLWSGKRYEAGTHIEQWDGLLDDYATKAAPGNYTVKVLNNNVQYTWEGVIGNTSKSLYNNVHKTYDGPQGLAFTNLKGYIAAGYAERAVITHSFPLNDIQTSLLVTPEAGTSLCANVISTDGNLVYWAGYSPSWQENPPQNYYLMATDPSNNDLQHQFAWGTPAYVGLTDYLYEHSVGMTHDQNYEIHSAAPQQSGRLLFLAHEKNENKENDYAKIRIYNKTTGRFYKELPYPNLGKITVSNEYLWISSKAKGAGATPYKTQKYSITDTITDDNIVPVYSSSSNTNGALHDARWAFDGSPYTFFSANNILPTFVAVDAGKAVSSSVIKVMGRSGENRDIMVNCKIQGSNDNNSWDTLYTITNPIPGGNYTALNLNSSFAYRYWRILKDTASPSGIAELEFADVSFYDNPVSGDLTLTDTGVFILTETQPEALTLSPDLTLISVIDGTNSQVLTYNTSDGSQAWVLGQKGGYELNGPAVTYDKFMFHDPDNNVGAGAIAYQPDGSFWITDWGNYRILHFNADRSFKEYIGYVPKSRSCNADPNNPGKVFTDALEFQVDYSKVLGSDSDAWVLKNNWRVGAVLNTYGRYLQIITLSNGHTYGTSGSTLYDLLPTGAQAVTGFNWTLEADGAAYERQFQDNNKTRIYRHELIGFDDNNVPSWGPGQFIAMTTPYDDGGHPVWYISNTFGASTDQSQYVFFDPNTRNNTTGHHLGTIKKGVEQEWNWLSARSTPGTYDGDYPRDGYLDNGIFSGHSENCNVYVHDTDLFWNVNGEFWGTNKGGNQCNIWNHVHSSGLFIGNFGRTVADNYVYGTNYGIAGNAFKGALVKVADDYYIYHCDESTHGGTHRWKVSNVNSVALLTTGLQILENKDVVFIPKEDDLMIGLDYRSKTYGVHGDWTVGPEFGDRDDDYYAGFRVATSNYSAQQSDLDISMYLDNNDGFGTHFIKRKLPITNSNNWLFSQEVQVYRPGGQNAIRLLDIYGKIIVEINFTSQQVYFNRVLYADMDVSDRVARYRQTFNPITIANINNTMTFRYAGFDELKVTKTYDATADITKPALWYYSANGDSDRYRSLFAHRRINYKALANDPSASTPVTINHYQNVFTHKAVPGYTWAYGGRYDTVVSENADKYKIFANSNNETNVFTYIGNQDQNVPYQIILKGIEFTADFTAFVQYLGTRIVFTANDVSEGIVTISLAPTNSDSAFFFGIPAGHQGDMYLLEEIIVDKIL